MATSKKPFDLLFEKVTNTLDKTYSNQKSTFKGWTAFFKAFSSITKEYSNQLQKLSKDGGDHMGLKLPLPDCIKMENPTIKTIMSEMLYTVSSLSSLHHNLSERLLEMSEGYSQLYDGVKKTKDHFMQALQTNFPKDLLRTTPRETAQKRIAKSLYEMVDRMEEDEIERIQKIRENSIILYTVYKKIAEKQEEVVTSNATRLSKLEIENNRKDLSKLVNEVAELYNHYPGEPKIQKKNERLVQSVRDSLKMSRRGSKDARIESSQSSLKQIERQADSEEQRLIVEVNPKYELRRGLLAKGMTHYYQFASILKSQHLSSAVFSLLESFYFSELAQTDTKSNLMSIRVRLRLPEYKFVANRTQNIMEFLQIEFDYRSNADKLALIHSMLLSMHYSGWADEDELLRKMRQASSKTQLSSSDIPSPDFVYDVWVAAAFIDVLLESLFRFKDGSDFLVDNYSDLFKLICKFGRQYLQVEPQLILLMLMERVYRSSSYRDEHEVEPNIRQLERLVQTDDCQGLQLSDLSYYLRGSFRNVLFQRLLALYKPHTHTSLVVQFLHWIDLYTGSTDSLESILNCVRLAGYKYLCSKDPDRMLFGVLWENRERIKSLSDIIHDNEFVLIDQKILLPLAENISRSYNIGLEGVRKKVRQRFFSLILQTILLNLDSIDMQGLEDKDGHLLRIGIELCKIDQLSVQNLPVYEHNFFRLLPVALASMEAEYKDLLEQAKRTEMWIIEENMFATQNCYDFCSLLAKPIEFMVRILRETELAGTEASDFRNKFAMVVKVKLNEILKSEVVKYFTFLDTSLKKIECIEPRVLIDCKRMQSLPQVKEEDLKNNYESFRQVCKRLNNLLFVKQQIGEIVKDFLDADTQSKLTNIFQSSALEAEISRIGDGWNGELLKILRKVTKDILLLEQKILNKIAKGLVFVYLRRFFQRLYWRAEKSTFDDLFSNNSEVKLSEHTFLRHKEELEDYLQLVRRCIPAEYIQQFYQTFYNNLYVATKCEILNNTKLRVPLTAEVLFDYVNTDVANVAAIIKKLSSCSEQTVTRFFLAPVRKVLDQLREEPASLCSKFEQAFINKRQLEAEEILATLNLRCQQKDKKTKEFVKKYKGSLQR